MIERVTLAFDGGPASDAALAWVIERTKTVEMVLEITAVVGLDSELPLGAEADYDTPFEVALKQAREKVEAVRPDVLVTTKIRPGIPHEELIGASRHTDLLVIGTNKTTPVVGIIHGTLPLKVAGKAECTTVVVPVNWRPTVGKVVAGWSDDETAEGALDFAAKEAFRRQVGLTIVHAWGAPPAGPMDTSTSAIVVEELLSANRRLLADAAHRVQLAYPNLTITQGLHAGSPTVAIVGTAAGASLVVVGSRGHGVIADFFLGSVSHDVLLNMPTPVAIVPHKKEPVDVYPELVEDDL